MCSSSLFQYKALSTPCFNLRSSFASPVYKSLSSIPITINSFSTVTPMSNQDSGNIPNFNSGQFLMAFQRIIPGRLLYLESLLVPCKLWQSLSLEKCYSELQSLLSRVLYQMAYFIMQWIFVMRWEFQLSPLILLAPLASGFTSVSPNSFKLEIFPSKVLFIFYFKILYHIATDC